MGERTTARADDAGDAGDDHVGLDALLTEISQESRRLAEQCGTIQWSISAMLDIVDHPDLGAEIHMLQDVDRIQQTLADIAALLALTGRHAGGTALQKGEVGAAIRLESLRQRLGLSEELAGELPSAAGSEVTWL